MNVLKDIGYLLLGVFLTIILTLIVICVASKINNISFGEQITQWFGSLGNNTVSSISNIS